MAALAFEDPWLAVAQASVTLVDVDAAMRGGRGGLSGGKASHKRQVSLARWSVALLRQERYQ